VGVAVKHRQLARQVGIEHPLDNSMPSLSFISTVLDEGTTFIFSSWICIANGLSGFNSHLANSRKLEASTPTRCSDLDELLLPDLVRQIEKMSVFAATSTCAAPELVRLDSNNLGRLHSPSRSPIWRRIWIVGSFAQTQGRGSHRLSGGPHFLQLLGLQRRVLVD
jgi:hypothetical protein